MKWASYILSLVMLLSTLIPCSDAALSKAPLQQDSLQLVQAHHQDHQNTHSNSLFDFCSPFCSCQCCHTHVTVGSEFLFQGVSSHGPGELLSYYVSYFSSPSFSIWQPPKLV